MIEIKLLDETAEQVKTLKIIVGNNTEILNHLQDQINTLHEMIKLFHSTNLSEESVIVPHNQRKKSNPYLEMKADKEGEHHE